MVRVARSVRLWTRVTGRGDRTVVVPCCGNAPDFAPLEVPGRRVVYYDARNRGRSDPVDDLALLGFEEEVSDLAMVCDELELERVSLLGWSYHAGVAARLALADRSRIDRLVLAAGIPLRSGVKAVAVPEPAPQVLARLDQLDADGLPESDPERWCEEWRRAYIPLRMGVPSAYERLVSPCGLDNEHPRRVARSMVCVFAGLTNYDWSRELRGLDAPTLVCHGTADVDPIELAEEWLDALPDVRLLVLDGVGQYPWVEAPERFFHTVNRFLDGEAV